MTTDYVSKQQAADGATGNAPFAGLTDDDIEQLGRSIMHSLALNAEEELELRAQQRLLRAELKLRNANKLIKVEEQ